MLAIQYVKELPFKPWGAKSIASNSELRRWLHDGAIDINGYLPKPGDEIQFPIRRLVFFPRSNKRRVTLLLDRRLKVRYG